MANDSTLLGTDERLKKNAGASTRGSRDDADADRNNKDGSALSSAERRAALRKDWVQEVLPTPPEIQGFHCCWLSTTNSTDPVYKRLQRGYIPVKATEVPGFGGQFAATEGEFEGCIACNEMLLFKIDKITYQDMMSIYHHDIPREQESSIYDRVNASQEQDSNGRSLGIVEGDFDKLGRDAPTPTFA
jgi:hypothetical protein